MIAPLTSTIETFIPSSASIFTVLSLTTSILLFIPTCTKSVRQKVKGIVSIFYHKSKNQNKVEHQHQTQRKIGGTKIVIEGVVKSDQDLLQFSYNKKLMEVPLSDIMDHLYYPEGARIHRESRDSESCQKQAAVDAKLSRSDNDKDLTKNGSVEDNINENGIIRRMETMNESPGSLYGGSVETDVITIANSKHHDRPSQLEMVETEEMKLKNATEKHAEDGDVANMINHLTNYTIVASSVSLSASETQQEIDEMLREAYEKSKGRPRTTDKST